MREDSQCSAEPSDMPHKILLIEDQAEIRRLVRWSLEESTHTLYEAPNGSLGLSLAQTLRPDLVFLDVMLPGELDGIEVCQRIRADPALASALVVVLSADIRPATKARALEAGANIFLTKPFSPAKLLELTELLLRNRPTESVDPEGT
nr:response regulator [uncultured Roseateles sp.]